MIKLTFIPDTREIDMTNNRSDQDIISKYQLLDQTIDKCERQIGHWNPQYKFTSIYLHLDELCDKVESLDQFTMDNIGLRAKELGKTFESIIKQLSTMNEANYDSNKIEYLFELLEKQFESEEHVTIILDRLKALEKIHKESSNIEAAISDLIQKQALIDKSMEIEDGQINKSKRQVMEWMEGVQLNLKEVTMMQRNQ